MFDYVTHAIVRILDAQQRPVGAGCLVRDRLIVTCAHVIADALGIARDDAEAPSVPMALDFPFVPESLTKARVILWWPYREAVAGDRLHDLALLELDHPLDAAEAARLLRPGHERPGPIQVYGFPKGAGLGDLGDWIEGRVTPPLPNGWLKLVQRDQQARFIEPGCSGGPVVLDETGLVAGIVSLRRSGSSVAEAYGISAALIREALIECSAAAGGAGVDVPQDEPVEDCGQRRQSPPPSLPWPTKRCAGRRRPGPRRGKRLNHGSFSLTRARTSRRSGSSITTSKTAASRPGSTRSISSPGRCGASRSRRRSARRASSSPACPAERVPDRPHDLRRTTAGLDLADPGEA
jgi:hypothetical protein